MSKAVYRTRWWAESDSRRLSAVGRWNEGVGVNGRDEVAEEGGCESQIQEANSIYLKCRENDRGCVEGGMQLKGSKKRKEGDGSEVVYH